VKIAIAHDWLTNMGGAEKVVINFKEIYKDAPIYTTVYNPDNLASELQNIDVRTSFIQKFKKAKINHQKYLPFMPTAWEQFDFNEYDVVLSSSSSCAKGIVTSPSTMHVCYCHSPMRYAWEFYGEYMSREKVGKLKKMLIPYIMNYIRIWDVVSANRVDYFIANSRNVAKRIWKHYRREADVIHPPVKASYFNIIDQDEEYFLIVSRLVAYKRVDLAVEAFNELGLPLVVIGTGPQLEYLKSIAKDNVKIMGRQPDEVIREYYAKCRAFIFPGEEDFGITPLEAQASGRPVIAFGKGGVLETVVDKETGVFFNEQTIDSLKRAVNEFKSINFNKNKIRQHALQFDEEIFKEKIKKYIMEKYEQHKEKMSCVGQIYKG
jgi:glycosyltransferase involved in cell wall biosynthesis